MPTPGTRDAIVHRATLETALDVLPLADTDGTMRRQIEDLLEALDAAARKTSHKSHRKDRIRR